MSYIPGKFVCTYCGQQRFLVNNKYGTLDLGCCNCHQAFVIDDFGVIVKGPEPKPSYPGLLWRVEMSDAWRVINSQNRTVAKIYDDFPKDSHKIAKLFAAAPTLLELLHETIGADWFSYPLESNKGSKERAEWLSKVINIVAELKK